LNKVRHKMILLVVCLLVFIVLSKTLYNKKEEPEEFVRPYTDLEVIVYNTRDQVIRYMDLEEYIVGVVAAEMQASFSIEALKAQAIAARTYTLGRAIGKYGTAWENHFGAHVCTNPAHCQAWIPKEIYGIWYPKADPEESWQKVEQAVYETAGLILTYEGEVINPLYHANSGGITEDVQEVWSSVSQIPYLSRVYSEGEDEYSSYEKRVVFSGEEFRNMLLKEYPDIIFSGTLSDDIEVIQYTSSNRAREIVVGNIAVPGTKFREIFSLASTQIEINFPDDDTIEIKTYGFGHGVGMSQCGANELAEKGKDYEYILQYYYTGVEVEPIPEEIAIELKKK
jgi:stage II sporulation protein D